jgi:hypothetical protein
MGIAAVVSIIAFVGYKSYRSSQDRAAYLAVSENNPSPRTLDNIENNGLLSENNGKFAENCIKKGPEISTNGK